MERLFIFGMSGFARETNDVAHALGYQASYIAASAAERLQWRGEELVILEHEIGDFEGADFAIGIADTGTRRKIAIRYGANLNFVNLVHPAATFGKGQREMIEVRRGVIVCAGARFMNTISVGNFTVFGLNTTVGHDVVVEDYVTIAPGANISGNVRLCEGVWVGANATINQGRPGRLLAIGAGATIGSGAVVLKDCDPGGVYVGVPARKN